MIPFPTNLVHGYLVKRYKRFLADIRLDNGEIITAHCTNSGSMKSCIEENAEVYISPAIDTSRKTRFTWEMIKIGDTWVGINTSLPNRVAPELIRQNLIPGFEGFSSIRNEVKYGDSRLDFFVEKPGESCFIEVKNVTLRQGNKALFPDAVTVRGQKHLKTLMELKQKRMRAVMLYMIQRTDVEVFAPARDIDPVYADLLGQAFKAGVEVMPVQLSVSPQGVVYHGILPAIIQ